MTKTTTVSTLLSHGDTAYVHDVYLDTKEPYLRWASSVEEASVSTIPSPVPPLQAKM